MALLARAVHDKDSSVWTTHSPSSPADASAYPDELALLGADGVLDVIFDSGASGHFLPDKAPMFNYKVMEGKVRLGDNDKSVDIVGQGDTNLFNGVLHVPKMSYGLISISRFDKQGCMSIYHNRRCWVVSHEGTLLCSGTLRGNLYHLDEKYRKILFSDSDTDRESEDEHTIHLAALVKRLVSTRLGYNDIELLHQRWAHANEQSIKQAVRDGRVKDCDCEWDKIKNQRSKLLFSDTDTDRESEDEHEFHLAALVKRLVSTRLG
eukprot:CAMPEP_0173331452 /NCGR_PEP_ID=MMETSP1144-20121109/3805_1 /TAXON_ID=483371 /ORGANISM="non described non described, Strain CCMP2298" /LENGTH=263 /DNA_ID=CAMNT_0014276227 /DNA_START=180 /DNA_END=968 /DNA_ORIENTATION=-